MSQPAITPQPIIVDPHHQRGPIYGGLPITPINYPTPGYIVQVRYASSLAARDMLMGIEERLDDALALVMPAMCLNRYYVAEGVRVLSQETWKLLMKDEGPQRVARHIDAVVPYYIMQSKVRRGAAPLVSRCCWRVYSIVFQFEMWGGGSALRATSTPVPRTLAA